MDTPEQKLADIESKARFKILIVCIVAAAACFLEFILVVTLPIQAGYDTFLSFSQGATVEVNPAFQYGLVIFVSLIGLIVSVLQIFINMGKYARLLLACVPVQIVLAMMQIICFVLWALVTELYDWFGAGLPFCLIAIVAHFGCALGATNVLMLPQYVRVSQTAVEDRKKE